MLLAIQNGSTYDFLFLIIRYPKLLAYKDRKGNNLLHLAAKGNWKSTISSLKGWESLLSRKTTV